jgi:hypothetical protein
MMQFLLLRRSAAAFLVACLFTLVPVYAQAKKLTPVVSEEEVSRALMGQKELYLRGCYLNSTLEFNSEGVLRAGGHSGSFAMSGIDVQKVKVTDKEIRITGVRVALYREDRSHRLSRQPLKKAEIHISIALEGSTKEQAMEAVHLIFADGYDEMVPGA